MKQPGNEVRLYRYRSFIGISANISSTYWYRIIRQ